MRVKLVALVLGLVVLLAGCKVDATVSIRVNRDGSGAVTVTAVLDGEAVKAAETGGGKLEDRVRLGDLDKAGWTVKWTHAADGSAQIALRKPFQSPDQVAGIMQEVSGATGPLRDVTLTRDRGPLSTHYDVKGTLDLAQLQTGVAADPEVVGSLTNQQVDLNALDQSLVAQIKDSFGLTVDVRLPGGDTKVVGTAGKRTAIDASTSVLDTQRIGLILVAIVLVLTALLVLLWPSRRSRSRSRRGRRPSA
jgi:hypothetical protein